MRELRLKLTEEAAPHVERALRDLLAAIEWRTDRPATGRSCRVCGKPVSGHTLARYCSDECRREKALSYQREYKRRVYHAGKAEQKPAAPVPQGRMDAIREAARRAGLRGAA